MGPALRAAVGLAAIAAVGCSARDPRKELEITEVETYWVVDTPKGGTHFIAPAARLRLRSRSRQALRAIQATANFRREGEEEVWGSGWEQVSTSRKPLAPGAEASIVLRSENRYTSTGDAQSMFAHAQFKDVRAEIFLRIGSSSWTKMAEAPIERRVGSRSARALAGP
jgi:hypothetical protein